MERPKTAKKFDTMHYLSPTKSSLAIPQEEIHLHPAFFTRPQSRKLDKSKPWSVSMKNIKTSRQKTFTITKKSRSRSRRRRLSQINFTE